MLRKKYPRPRVNCDQCNQDMILCWGKIIVNPYLKHQSVIQKCNNNGISEFHKMAQNLLTNFLNNNGTVKFRKKCECCSDILFEKNLKYIKEYCYQYKDKKCIYDIVGIKNLDIISEPIIGIEIFYKHRAEKTFVRNKIQWVEIDADEIFLKLDGQTDNSIILEDISCYKDLKEQDEQDIFEPECTKIEPPRQCQICKKMNIASDKPMYFKSCSKCYSVSMSVNFDYYTLTQFQCELKYLDRIENFKIKTQMIHSMALYGYYHLYKYYWNIVGNLKYPAGIWISFIKRKQCLKCGIKQNTKYKSPFCINCYRSIKNNNIEYSEKIEVSIEYRQFLISKLNWLNDIPGDWRLGSLCYFCKSDTNSIKGFTEWNNDKKCCCIICLENEMEKRELL